MLVAVGATAVGGVTGVILGLIAGYMGGIVDAVLMRIMDGVLAFPFILLSIVLMTVLGSGIINVILAIGIAEIPRFARVVRGQVLIVKKGRILQCRKGDRNISFPYADTPYPAKYCFRGYRVWDS